MESKTKHRILGVVVVAGLAVLAYPFIQGSSKAPGEQALVKAPAFPDQAVQVASTEELASAQPQDTTSPALSDATPPATPTPDANTVNPVAPQAGDADGQSASNVVNVASPDAPTTAAAETTPATPSATPDASPQQDTAQPSASNDASTPATTENSSAALTPTSDADRMTTSPSAETTETPVEPAKAQMTEDDRAVPEKSPVKHARHKKVAKAHAKDQPVILSKLTSASAIKANRHQPLDNNGLLQLKKSAWVIQLGSFKEKSNALRLVNKLRASGYRAFIQHVAGNSGQNTRVFVGPEHQQASARIVASELQSNLKLHGIVISYKPFSL